LVIVDSADRRDDVAAVERTLAGEHLVEHHAEREDVAAHVAGPTHRLFGRHVGDGSHHRARLGHRQLRGRFALVGAEALGQPEVENLREAVGRDDHVGRFQIAVEDAARMRFGQAVSNLNGVVERLIEAQGTSCHSLRQCFSLEILHHEEVDAILAADVEQRANVGVAQPGHGACLALEAFPRARLSRRSWR
jgi:hypothetical protein